ASSDGMAHLELGPANRIVIAVLDREIEAEDRLILDGLSDRAQKPNVLERLRVPLGLPRWPAATDGVVFLWESADAPNAVYDAATGTDRTFSLKRMGGALLDRHYAMVVDHGIFAATEKTGRWVSQALQSANEFSLEVTVTSRVIDAATALPIVSLGLGRRANLQLVQERDRLALGLMSGREYRLVPLMVVSPGVMTHVVVTYSPGRLVAYKNGVEVLSTDQIQDDFFHWDPKRLTFGHPEDDKTWEGTIQGVVIYRRRLDPSEVAENHDRFRRKSAARKPVESYTLKGRLVQASATPSLQEISPYREALSVNEYEVLSVSGGDYPGSSIRVAQWSILDGETLPGGRPGDIASLRVELLTDNPQLESIFVSDTIGPGNHQIFYAADPGPIAKTERRRP
ncbi:MAG: LamG-like jellyroll fold domain-containing protein, partial [Thermoanaerobaculia bacterium]